MTQADKATLFQNLHVKGDPIVLYNIWDAGTARAVVKAGAKAVATGSASVAGAQGYPDGQDLPLELLLTIASRIAASVDVPFTVDFEGGYAVKPEGVAANVTKVIEAGAIEEKERIIVGGVGAFYPYFIL
ncbi:MAG: isocitrate lyase/phosphoenolpyruvate mutase family protein, partial [Cohaesibacteraceae bacterium]|nr:isocitrate lyase/phosphoenolpyruvate mutase family protein [Cohaesibacteraceae bacterium]